jgi:starch phosphorylase
MPDRVTIPTLPPAGAMRIPAQLEGLHQLAYNLYWTWHPSLRLLFSRIDSRAWMRYRNPIPVLQGFRDWADLGENPAFMADYQTAMAEFERYMSNGAGHWFTRHHGEALAGPIAYFCAEYGLHESLGIYSGGLGVLAGDHLKTASDMALPFVGVGLFYRRGYFRQAIDADGHQEHAYPDYDTTRLPFLRVADQGGDPLVISVELPGREVKCAVWVIQVGRVPLLLLDSDIPDNAEQDRPITHILYVRGREMRLHQEILLGMGGVRALRALGVEPTVWHLNEGHSAFMLVERARELTSTGVPQQEALERVGRNAVFTLHTPVPAGNEKFDATLVRDLVSPVLADSGLDVERVIELGRGVDDDPGQFDMTAFSLRHTTAANAVSKLHARTANETWSGLLGREIQGITNGVHVPTWAGLPMRERYEDVGADLDHLDDEEPRARFWEHLDRLSGRHLWDAHQRQKLEFAFFARGRLRNQFARHGEAPAALAAVSDALDPAILTVGFARRFATYKRAGLLFLDEERLARILWDEERPVQVVYAGKAHPADRPGQAVIEEIFGHSRSERFRGRVFMLEDYDMRVARFLVQGVDVWLNNPRRPLEASGTSGMKAAANGVINCSVLDGWWDEGFTGTNGWAIGGRKPLLDEGAQDWADAQDLYRLLEEEIVPRYYERDDDGLPSAWVGTMREAISSTIWRFSATRMLEEYTESMYVPEAGRSKTESGSSAADATDGRRPGRRAAGRARRPEQGRGEGIDAESSESGVLEPAGEAG